MESYRIPAELETLENSISKKLKHSHDLTEYYWYFETEKSGVKYEKVIQSTIAEKYLLDKDYLKKTMAKQAGSNSLIAYRSVEAPLIVYSTETVLTRYVLVDRLYPLRIHVYNQSIVSFIHGPYFVKELASPEESMHYSSFLKILYDRRYKRNKIENISPLTNLAIIVSILSVWTQLNEQEAVYKCEGKDHSFIVSFMFMSNFLVMLKIIATVFHIYLGQQPYSMAD